MDGTCSTRGINEKFIQNFGRKREGKRLLGRPGRRWEDDIRMDLSKIGLKVWAEFIWLWIGITGGLVVNMVMNLRVPEKVRHFLIS
jgi:hypothetical protein